MTTQLEYTIPGQYASYLCNDDDSGLDKGEIQTIKDFLVKEKLGNHDWDVKRDADGHAGNSYFSKWHDLDSSQALVLDFVVTVFEDKL